MGRKRLRASCKSLLRSVLLRAPLRVQVFAYKARWKAAAGLSQHDGLHLVAAGRGYSLFAASEQMWGDVVDALSGAGLPYVVLPRGTDRALVMRMTDIGAAKAALGAVLGSRYTVQDDDRSLVVTSVGVFHLDGGEGLRFPHSVVVSFWDVVQDDDTPSTERGMFERDTLVEEIGYPDSTFLTPETWRECQEDSSHIPPALRRSPIFKVDFPIDVVYTWVDDSDPAWRARRDAALGGQSSVDDSGVADRRFASHDELRYSLRSLGLNAGWVNHIYIVTDQQVPKWLDTDNPRITVVDHRDIFRDPSVLPTFNSHAIESQLHHIKGLSEHYLYMNDDVFFGTQVAPEDFFLPNGIAKFFLSRVAVVDPNGQLDLNFPITAAAKNARTLLGETFGVTLTDKFKHTPHPQRRSTFDEMEERWPEAFAATASHKFRGANDVSFASFVHHYYGYVTGRSVPAQLKRYSYIKIADPSAQRLYYTLLRWRNAKAFCLNESDVIGDSSRHDKAMREFLEAYFPIPSEFELEDH